MSKRRLSDLASGGEPTSNRPETQRSLSRALSRVEEDRSSGGRNKERWGYRQGDRVWRVGSSD
jgi:hypothetical protein